MDKDFNLPTEYRLQELTIDGEDVSGFFLSLSIYENIYTPAVTGFLMIIDTDGGGLLETQGLEFTEDIAFTFTNAEEEELKFEGHLNGLSNEVTKDSKKVYTINFVSKVVRENEQSFVTKRFADVSPSDIVTEMLDQRLSVENTNIMGEGRPMNYLGSRRKPLDVVKYVLTHGVVNDRTQPSADDNDDGEATSSDNYGYTGFLCWETIKEFRFASINQILDGEIGETHKDYIKQLQNRSLSMEDAMKGIIDYEFPRLGDQQTKMRSGGYRNKVITFDLDKGHYDESENKSEEHMTDKQKEAVKFPTRFLWKPYTNEKFMSGCDKAQPNTGDQSRLSLSQNTTRQNTFDDQLGEFTLPPHFEMSAGDTIDVKLSKVESEKEGGYDEKHSGKYVIKALGHHFTVDGRAYTKIATIRSTTQQDEEKAQ